ncbi:MAG: hypothetical protein ACXWZP_09775, partial [Gaiellaceae bacterium]
QVMRDLTDAPADEVAAERARVAREGWGAHVLASQDADGRWNGGTLFPYWISTAHALQLLYAFGIDPTSGQAQRAIEPVHEAARWEYDENMRFFDGEVEPCINGRTVAIGTYFGRDMSKVVDRLLTEQMADGGWNCEQENGSTRGSFDTTLNVLEGLLEFERTTGANGDVTAARVRGEEYLLERGLLRRLSDGEIGQKRWLYAGFPEAWFYTLPRVLDYLRVARPGPGPDERMAEALEILRSKRDAEGRWPLDHAYNDASLVDFGEAEGKPSRWITLRALRILRWAEGAGQPAASGSASS